MTPAVPRDRHQRIRDTLAKLTEAAADVWVATASASGADPYLVPLSLAWVDGRVMIAVDGSSRTARNLEAGRTARLALGPTRDVVVIDAVLDQSVPVAAAPELAERYVQQADWDPRTAGECAGGGNRWGMLLAVSRIRSKRPGRARWDRESQG